MTFNSFQLENEDASVQDLAESPVLGKVNHKRRPNAYELFLYFLFLLLAARLCKSPKFYPLSHAHLHCGLLRRVKRNSFVEGFIPKLKMTFLNLDEP
jgi:hypothetical protein